MKSTRLSLMSDSESTPLWFALTSGSDGEEGDKDKGDKQDKSGDGGADKDDKQDKDADKDDPAQRKIKALNEEKDRHFTARTEAEKARDDALARLKEIEDKDKSEAELKDERLKTLETAESSLREQNEKLALENAFLKDNEFKWHKPDVALRLADLSEVKIDKNGKVTGLKEALKLLAADSPFLLDTGKKDDDADDKDSKSVKSGSPAGSRSKPEGDAAKQAELRRKYPALRRG